MDIYQIHQCGKGGRLLGKDHITYQNVTFKQDDKCGTTSEHAKN